MFEVYRVTPSDFPDDILIKIHEYFQEGHEVVLPNVASGWRLAVDVYENQDNLVFVAEIAGVRHNDIKIIVTETTVHFTGHRGPTCSKSRGFYHRMEIPTGKFSRKFALPVMVYPNKGQAKVIDGMLYLLLPKQNQ